MFDFLVSFMMTQPCCSTLFPYTTLFRSYFQSHTVEYFRVNTKIHIAHQGFAAQFQQDTFVFGTFLLSHGDQKRDRKSTRLNSSHVKTSYAVFCLKKKTKIMY